MMSTAVVNTRTECPFQAGGMTEGDQQMGLAETDVARSGRRWSGVAMKARRNRFWISGRLIFLGQFHWKSSSEDLSARGSARS